MRKQNHQESTPEIQEPKKRNILWRYKYKTAFAITALSLGATYLLGNDLDKNIEVIEEEIPEYFTILAAEEAVWIGGAAVALASVGSAVKNPFKIKKAFSSVASKARNSVAFKAGLYTNTAAALAEAATVTYGITTNLPPSAWGSLSFAGLDLAATIVFRAAIFSSIHTNEIPAGVDTEFSVVPPCDIVPEELP